MTRIDIHPSPFSWRRVLRGAAIGTAAVLVIVVPASGPRTVPTPSSADVSMLPGETATAESRSHKTSPSALLSSGGAAGGDRAAKDAANATVCSDRVSKAVHDMPEADQAKLMERIYKSLAASSDERVRSAGLYLAATTQQTNAHSSALDEVSRECRSAAESTPACDKAQQSLEKATAERQKAGAAQLEELAREAAHTKDPSIYAAALRACKAKAKAALAPSCSLVTLDQWARLDARNGAVWLHMIDRAKEQGDGQALTEALHRLSQADTSDYYAFSVADTVLRNLPADLTPAEKMVAYVRGGMVWTDWDLPSYRPLVNECSGAWAKDANRAQTCEAIAKLMTTRDKTLMGAMIGTRIGEGLGWPADRVLALRTDLRALMASGPAVPIGGDKPEQADCDWPRQLGEWMGLVGERGEVGAGLELARRSGRSMTQLRAEYADKRAAAASGVGAAASGGTP